MPKKFYPLSFPILGGRDSTSPFQNPGGGGQPERDRAVVVVVAEQFFSFVVQDYDMKVHPPGQADALAVISWKDSTV